MASRRRSPRGNGGESGVRRLAIKFIGSMAILAVIGFVSIRLTAAVVTSATYDPAVPGFIPWIMGAGTIVVIYRLGYWYEDHFDDWYDRLGRLRAQQTMTDRAALNLVDTVMAGVVLVVFMLLAPTIYVFIGLANSSAGPLTRLLLSLAVPSILVSLLLSVGRSARRAG